MDFKRVKTLPDLNSGAHSLRSALYTKDEAKLKEQEGSSSPYTRQKSVQKVTNWYQVNKQSPLPKASSKTSLTRLETMYGSKLSRAVTYKQPKQHQDILEMDNYEGEQSYREDHKQEVVVKKKKSKKDDNNLQTVTSDMQTQSVEDSLYKLAKTQATLDKYLEDKLPQIKTAGNTTHQKSSMQLKQPFLTKRESMLRLSVEKQRRKHDAKMLKSFHLKYQDTYGAHLSINQSSPNLRNLGDSRNSNGLVDYNDQANQERNPVNIEIRNQTTQQSSDANDDSRDPSLRANSYQMARKFSPSTQRSHYRNKPSDSGQPHLTNSVNYNDYQQSFSKVPQKIPLHIRKQQPNGLSKGRHQSVPKGMISSKLQQEDHITIPTVVTTANELKTFRDSPIKEQPIIYTRKSTEKCDSLHLSRKSQLHSQESMSQGKKQFQVTEPKKIVVKTSSPIVSAQVRLDEDDSTFGLDLRKMIPAKTKMTILHNQSQFNTRIKVKQAMKFQHTHIKKEAIIKS